MDFGEETTMGSTMVKDWLNQEQSAGNEIFRDPGSRELARISRTCDTRRLCWSSAGYVCYCMKVAAMLNENSSHSFQSQNTATRNTEMSKICSPNTGL